MGQLIGPYNIASERISEAADTICECNHWYSAHEWFNASDGRRYIFESTGETDMACGIEDCAEGDGFPCDRYRFGVEQNTPQAIADRGEEHRAECFCALCREEGA